MDDEDALIAKVNYFTAREVRTQEFWLEAALIGDVQLARKIQETGFNAEHYAADAIHPPAVNFPENLAPVPLAHLRGLESMAEQAIVEFETNRRDGAYNQQPGAIGRDFNK